MLDGDPFLARQHLPHHQHHRKPSTTTSAGAPPAGTTLDFASRLAPPHAVKPTFTLLGASSLSGSTLTTSTRGKENAPSGLAPSPRLVLSSSSSSSSASASGSSRTDSLRKRRVTFSPTPLPSLHSEPRHKRVWVALGGHGAAAGEDQDNDERRAGKRRRTSSVYSNNPLLLSARDAGSSSSSSSPPTCDSPLFDLDMASTRSATPPTSSSSPAAAAPTRSSALRVCSAAPRSPPRPPPFRPFTVPVPSSSSAARLGPALGLGAAAAGAAEGDATDSETESDAVQSLLLPRASSSSASPVAATAAAAAAAAGGVAPFPSSPGAALLALSSSSPLPSPSRSARPTVSLARGGALMPPAPLRSILKPRPRTPGALLPLGSEKEANRRNARGRKHVASWDSERKAVAVAAARGRAQAQATGQGEGSSRAGGSSANAKGKGRARDSAPSRAAASASRGGARTSRVGAAAGAPRAGGGGAGGGRDEDDEDQQRRRRLNAGSSAGPASSSSAATLGGADDTKRIVYDLEADDPVHFRSSLLVLRASLRPAAAFPPLSTAAYDGAAPSLPPRPHPDAPPVEDDASASSSRRRFAAPTLLSDVEQAYVFLTHAAFRLPAELVNADKTLEPLRTLGAVLVRAVTRDIGNVATFAAWADAQPSPALLAPGLSAGLSLSGSSSPLGSAGDAGELGATPSPPLEGTAAGTASQSGPKRSLSEEQMRRLRDEMGAAQAAVKCLAAMLRDVRIVALFDDDTLSTLVRLVASIPRSPTVYALVQQNLFPFVPFFLRNIQLSTAILEPLLTSTILPSLAVTLSLPARIDRHRFTLGESLSALSTLVPHAALARRMLADEAWRVWLPAAWKGLWDGPKKGTSVRDRTVKLLGGVVRALTIELDDGLSEEDAKWEVERQVVAEKMGEELQTLFNTTLPEPHADADVKTWLDLLSKQLDSAQQPGPDGDEPSLSARFGVISLLAVLPPLMRSSFRRLEHKLVPRQGQSPRMQVGVGPWIRPINDTQAHSDSGLLVLSSLVWLHLAYAFCGASSPATKSWVLRSTDRRPFYVFTSILKSRQEVWLKHANDEVDEARRKERKDQARALTLVLTGVTFGATVHVLHGISPERNPAADIDPPTSDRKLEQFDFVAKELLGRYLPLATSSPPVSSSTATLGWQLLGSILRPRTIKDRSARLDKLVNTAFLDGQLSSLSEGKQALFVASALDRAVQPQDVPGWGRTWVTTRVDKVLELFEACLPANEGAALVKVAIADTWRSLILSLVSTPSSLRTALVWLVKHSSPTSRHASIVSQLWAVVLAHAEEDVVREVKGVLVGEREALAVATGAWRVVSEPASAYAAVFVSAWTTALDEARPQDVSPRHLEVAVRLLCTRTDAAPDSSLSSVDAGWYHLAHAVNYLVWQDGPASSVLSSHLASLVSAPSDIVSDLHLVTLLASASADLGVDVQDNILALSEYAVDHILTKGEDSHANLARIARLLEVASDEAFPSLYDRILQVLGRSLKPTSHSLRHLSILLAPSLARAQTLSLALDEPDSQAFLGASLAQQSYLHPVHRPILVFDTFWKATFGRVTEDLDIPEDLVDLLSIMRKVSVGFVVPGLADSQETASQAEASGTSAPRAAQTAPTHPRLTRTTATTAANLSGRGYDADQSRLPAESASYSSGVAESSFTADPSSRRGGRAASPSLGAPMELEQETQVVDETPKEVEVQRARESFAALTSEATELELAGVEAFSSIVESDVRAGKKKHDHDDEVIAATDDDETPPNKGPTPTQNKRTVPTTRRTRSSRVEPAVVETKPASKKRRADAASTTPAGGSKKKRKGATTRSRSRGQTESSSPTPSTDSSIVIENSQPAPTPAVRPVAPIPVTAAPVVTDSQEETLRRFFALPLDTVIEAGKRLGGSPSLKRLMDLGERAKEYFERVSSQSSSSQ